MRAIRMLGGTAAVAFALTVTGTLAAQQASQTSAPKNATGQCTDGSYTTAKTEAKGCLKHGGVKTWYASATAPAATESNEQSGVSSTSTAPGKESSSGKRTASASSGAKPKDATGECTDGSYTTAKTQARGCLKHGGVKTWYGGAAAAGGTSPTADENAAAAAAPPPPAASAAPTPAAPAPTAAPSASHARATTPAAVPAQAPTNPTDVWVNTSTKAYHCPGTKWYGTTKHGKYMSEADAKAAGFHPSYGKSCGS
jgi:Protein of unknown function (DUF3761)